MPTNLPPRPAPPVGFAARLAIDVTVWTLLWRFQLSSAIKPASFGVFRFAVSLSDRRPTVGLRLIRLATMIARVANWIEPNRNGPFLRRTLPQRPGDED
jgi:hypothetical protein